MCRDEVLVYSRIDGLICAEAIVRSLKPPHPDLRDKVLVDFLDHVLVLDDQFEDMRLPAACTPLSVRAHLTKEDFLGSSALALEIAPAATNAWNKSPSMVLWSCVLWYLVSSFHLVLRA